MFGTRSSHQNPASKRQRSLEVYRLGKQKIQTRSVKTLPVSLLLIFLFEKNRRTTARKRQSHTRALSLNISQAPVWSPPSDKGVQ
jgi:hypothetical protein